MTFDQWWTEYLREQKIEYYNIVTKAAAKAAWEAGRKEACKDILDDFNESIRKAWPEEETSEYEDYKTRMALADSDCTVDRYTSGLD